MRTLSLFVLWALLLFTVSSMILQSDNPLFLAELALLAWLGGLVANELIRWVIFRYRRSDG